MSSIAANLEAVRRRIAAARPGTPGDVVIVAVSKQRDAEAIRAAAAAGCTDIGESYLQEALPKIAALAGSGLRWHFIGHVQTNKAREIASKFDWVHAVDRVKVAAALDRARPAGMAPLDVCVQVISPEPRRVMHPRGARALPRGAALRGCACAGSWDGRALGPWLRAPISPRSGSLRRGSRCGPRPRHPVMAYDYFGLRGRGRDDGAHRLGHLRGTPRKGGR